MSELAGKARELAKADATELVARFGQIGGAGSTWLHESGHIEVLDVSLLPGDRRYQTLLYADGSTSCDCPGWCRRVAGDGSRSCRHTRSVLLGTADQECQSMHHHAGAAPTIAAAPVARSITDFGRMGRRKIHT